MWRQQQKTCEFVTTLRPEASFDRWKIESLFKQIKQKFSLDASSCPFSPLLVPKKSISVL